MITAIREALAAKGSRAKAASSARFFRTGPGQYGEGDVFLGVTVPEQRAIAKRFADAPFGDLETMLADPVHEMRLTALHILALRFKKADADGKKAIADFYLRHLDGVNNWDLVDSSAPYILGAWLLPKKDRSVLYRLARSGKLWRERVAIVATQELIRHREFEDTIRIATILLHHKHDLIHKAVGWMLREVGKKDDAVLRAFLDEHAATMPRTALRYAIEKMSPAERARYRGMAAASRNIAKKA
jgi:3-methyladenine DNA glycosylase AlkD